MDAKDVRIRNGKKFQSAIYKENRLLVGVTPIQWMILKRTFYFCGAQTMIRQYKDLILQAYEAFNERDIALVLSLMHPAVGWPNEWKGGRLSGQAEIEAYWGKQFEVLNPTVTPLSIRERRSGQIEVQVNQPVKDLTGNILIDNHVLHVYTMEEGLIRSMQVERIAELSYNTGLFV